MFYLDKWKEDESNNSEFRLQVGDEVDFRSCQKAVIGHYIELTTGHLIARMIVWVANQGVETQVFSSLKSYWHLLSVSFTEFELRLSKKSWKKREGEVIGESRNEAVIELRLRRLTKSSSSVALCLNAE